MAFWPLIELFPRIFQWQPDESAKTKRAKMTRVLEQVQLPVEETIPLLATLLALSLPEDGSPPLARSSPGRIGGGLSRSTGWPNSKVHLHGNNPTS